MKKIITFIVVLLLVFSVCACEKSNVNQEITPTPTATAQSGKITEERAIEIASEYWNVKSGDIDAETGFPFLIMPVDSTNDNYKIALKWLVENTNYSTLDIIEIDSTTGEIL